MQDRANTETAKAIREQRARKHNRRTSSQVPPDIYDQNGPSDSEEDGVNPAETEEAQKIRAERAAKRRHKKQQSSAAIPNLWKGDGDSDADSENSDDNENPYANTEQAKAIREQRAQKAHHRKKSSAAPPKDIFEAPDDSPPSSDNDEQGTGRRGSQVVEPADPRYTDAAVSKREARQEKHHRRESSGAQPNIWKDDYNPEKGARVKCFNVVCFVFGLLFFSIHNLQFTIYNATLIFQKFFVYDMIPRMLKIE